MVLHLGENLGVPLRERNLMLAAAGFAPHYPQRAIDGAARTGLGTLIQRVLDGHMPHPALAVDRYWVLLAANDALRGLLYGVDPELLQGEVNVLRLSLHPRGLASRILNLDEWRHHLLHRLDHDIEVSADRRLATLRDELVDLPVPSPTGHGFDPVASQEARIAVPLRLQTESGPVAFLSTTTVFGTSVDVALSEVTIEAFFPIVDA